ncbi:hypothetical protein GCM10022214_37520 [Actinomadura miaoliensis]|uniref:Transposase DDE domain-containing protein n=1 Tax=Actinomadura miaoliensis TaxID=430685 RepID=A0ABP7VXC4_9ACTN
MPVLPPWLTDSGTNSQRRCPSVRRSIRTIRRAWQNAFQRLARCYEGRVTVIDAFFDLTDSVITVRSLIRRAWMTRRWDERPNRRP